MKRISLTFLCWMLCLASFASNPFWVQMDKKILNQLHELDKSKPNEVEKFFLQNRRNPKKENLGFGWSLWNTRIGGGYISLNAVFVYYNDSIINYRMYSDLPADKKLIVNYSEWFKKTFDVDSGKVKPFRYGENSLFKPLAEYNGPLTTKEVAKDILTYMTPYSGTTYGYAGGYSGDLLSNRRDFINIEPSLTPEKAILLMYSINPASRLTAIEYYKKNKDKFSNQKKIEDWIEKVYLEVLKVETLFGCTREAHESRFLVEYYSRIKEDLKTHLTTTAKKH